VPEPMPAPEAPTPAVRCRAMAATSPYYLVPDNIDAGRLTFTVDFCLDANGRIVQATARDARLVNALPATKGRLEQRSITRFFGDTIPPGGPPSAVSLDFTVELFFAYIPRQGPEQTYRDELVLTVDPGGATRQRTFFARLT